MIELLAPAGSPEKLETAFRYGADAVYLAGKGFGLRASAQNFSETELAWAIAYAHSLGRKVYVTANIYAHQADLPALRAYLALLEQLRPDGLLIADPGVFALAETHAPSVPRQISTQASVTNAEACMFWYERGVRRIVLARELTLDEIRTIRASIPADLELEVFVHGAMCMAYSGRCLLSNFLTDRDANQGRCSQPCRWRFKPQGHDETLMVEEDERGSYVMSSRDLCLLPAIPDLIEAGVSSLKIEGRMKGAYYVAVATKAYRAAIDAYYAGQPMPEDGLTELAAMVHRPYSTGFLYGSPREVAQIFSQATYMKEAVVLGIVQGSVPNGYCCEQRNKLCLGDEIEVIAPHGPTKSFVVASMIDMEGNPIDATPHPQMRYILQAPFELETGSFLRKRGDKDRDPDAI